MAVNHEVAGSSPASGAMVITLDENTVRHVAKLARIALTDEEVKNFAKDFESILSAFKSLQKVDTTNVPPSFHSIELKDELREDKPESCLSQKVALSNTKLKENSFFKGPRAV